MRTGEGYNILIVDDNPAIIESLSEVLSNEKMIGSIQSAVNGKQAIDKLVDGNIECVLMDLNMPVLDGYKATEIIKKQMPAIKVLVISMWMDDRETERLYRVGADACLLKDTKTEELLDAIETVMEGREYKHLKDQIVHPPKQSTPVLTQREEDIVRCISHGLTPSKIASKLSLQAQTVDAHIRNILAKLHLKNKDALEKYAKGKI